MSGFRKELGCLREEFHEEINDLRIQYQECINKINDLSDRLDKQESRLTLIETSYQENDNLKMQLHNLKEEIKIKDQLSLQYDIEITGITENKGESVMHLTGIIMNKIGAKVDERDIVDARRIGSIHASQGDKQLPRPIVVRVTRRTVHEEILRSARIRRNVTTKDLGLTGTTHQIYLNERLTKENRQLLHKTRLLAKKHKWEYIWTNQGRVLTRESDGKTAFRIRCESDLDRIFK